MEWRYIQEHIGKGDIGLTQRKNTHGVGTYMEKTYMEKEQIQNRNRYTEETNRIETHKQSVNIWKKNIGLI